MIQMKDHIAKALSEAVGISSDDVKALFTQPPQPAMGDIAFPCFQLAKTLRKAPALIAGDLKENIDHRLANPSDPLAKVVDRVDAVGAYLNFFLRRDTFAEEVIRASILAGNRPGASEEGKGKTVIVEYSSPNIAKPFHVGHGFSTFLGEAIANLYEYAGYNVERFNHLGDYGTQFGKLIVAWKRWGNPEALKEAPISELTRIYVKFHDEVELLPDLEDEARQAFTRLEQGSEEEMTLWHQFRRVSLDEFNDTYERVNIHFDNMNGESFYAKMTSEVVDLLSEKRLLVESEGAQIVDLEDHGLNPCLILKNDGSTIYATRDIAAVLYRDRMWNFFRNIYVVGIPQINHFNQIFAVMEKLGMPNPERNVHVAFGTVRFADGVFSTRKGNIVLLDELLDAGVAHARAIVKESHPDLGDAEIDEIAERIGVGAVRYTYLASGRERDILFSWEDILDYEGDTAPYLLYTVTRCVSLLRKAEPFVLKRLEERGFEDAALLIGDDEQRVLKEIVLFPESLAAARAHYEPSMMLRRLMQLARAFNTFYHSTPILRTDDTALVVARLALVQAVERTLKAGLRIAGIEPVDRM
ncbi:MAG: arginine--tRNA ligase [Clostridiaceae bacterium]|nr:arginine--tRNA ligase [Clostridiaceae bacterium]